ncbi:MAG: DHHW family protein [Oscillospiraceae bacterium]|nr:DHHW family protein [Oscillospiraceae bacterium]
MDKKTASFRNLLTTIVFAAFICGFFFVSIVISPPAVLFSERRLPARFPSLSMKTVLSGEFMDRFNTYAADNFPLRDGFRGINSFMVFYLYFQRDKNGLYIDDYGIGEYSKTNTESLVLLSEKISSISTSLVDINLYISIIPDKSIYSNRFYPGYDGILVEKTILNHFDTSKYHFIDLGDVLDAGSYYGSDLHWNQVELLPVIEKLGIEMGFDMDSSQYDMKSYGEFYGVYAGQLALATFPDELSVLLNPSIKAMYLNELTMELEPGLVYDESKLEGLDKYDIFLAGANPLIVLINEDSTSERVLYLFRDSFSSSLAPLLANAYFKVYLIDLRYIDMRTLSRYIEFQPGSDALFLYSTLIVNNPHILQIN